MTVSFVLVLGLEKSIKSIFVIGLILLIRRRLNINSTKWANIILWSILFIYLLFPYSLFIQVEDLAKYGLLQLILKPMILFSKLAGELEIKWGGLLSKINRLFIASFLFVRRRGSSAPGRRWSSRRCTPSRSCGRRRCAT